MHWKFDTFVLIRLCIYDYYTNFPLSYISVSKVGNRNQGQPEGSLFNSYYTVV